MKEVHIPCEECISYAICVAKDYLECSILFKELKDPHVLKGTINSVVREVLLTPRQKQDFSNNNEKLRAFTKHLKHRTFILGFSTVHIFRADPVKPFKGDIK